MITLGHYQVKPINVGPYQMNARLNSDGSVFHEVMTPEMVRALEQITNRVKVNSLIVRWDMVPMDDAQWGDLSKPTPGNLPLFELEAAPGVVIPLEFGRLEAPRLHHNLLQALRGLPIQGLMRMDERDDALYVQLAADLNVPLYRQWEEVPREARLYLSPLPDEVAGRDFPFIVDPLFPKNGISDLTRAWVVPKLDVPHLKILEQAFQHGLVIKPALGARCQGLKFRVRNQFGSSASWSSIEQLAHQHPGSFVIQPFYPPRQNQGWNEIWRIYLYRTDLSKGFKVIGGGGLARRAAGVHGAGDSLTWPVLAS